MKTKKEERLYYQQLRDALSVEEREQRSKQIAEHYLNVFKQERPQAVHLFLPIAAKGEIDTLIILKRLNEEYPEVKTVTSVIATDHQSLLTLEIRIDTPLHINRWGIPEPVSRVFFPERDIQEVLTPLLAMDAAGYRLGYGKGFYDRFFFTCSSNVKRTGINFFPLTDHALLRDEWDVPLHRLISPEGVFNISEQWSVDSGQ
ncbi:MAG: 5-formyltetrahydrofolate cyclo-ligase [Chitinophagaceae bacterium]|nr:5-formyltetrahydrofolate cyclo-ligase [Chitinophagaceae bacterium]